MTQSTFQNLTLDECDKLFPGSDLRDAMPGVEEMLEWAKEEYGYCIVGAYNDKLYTIVNDDGSPSVDVWNGKKWKHVSRIPAWVRDLNEDAMVQLVKKHQ